MARLAAEVGALEAGVREARAAGQDAASQIAALRSRLEEMAQRTTEPGRVLLRPPTGEAGLTAPDTTEPRRAYGTPPTAGAGLADPATVDYAAALATFHAREHGQAVLDLLAFIARYPADPRTASAQYWIGEAYFVQRDYRQALVEFEKVLGRPKPNASAPESLWKIGLCHPNLRAPARARETWQRLVREYPASGAARHARVRLATRGDSLPR